jgi:hypothetical protein
MKAFNTHRHESGQILLILTVGIVALLGFLALAVDGGMIYADRRFDQNAADASSFAGAGAAAIEMQNRNITSNNFTCTGAFNADKSPKDGHILYHPINNAINAALQRAASNNFTIQYPLLDQHGVEIICVSSGGENYLEVRTVVSSTVRTAFAHLFYKGEVRNTVEAVARAATAYTAGAGGNLSHLSPDCSTPLRFSGGGGPSNIIKFNGAYTNGCVQKDGGSAPIISPSSVKYIDQCKNWGNSYDLDPVTKCPTDDTDFPELEQVNVPWPKYYLEEQNGSGQVMNASEVTAYWNDKCPKTPNPKTAAAFESTGTLQPGRYTEFSSKKKGNTPAVVTLASGLYCFDGNFDVGPNTTVKSAEGGVTIIMLNKSSINLAGNASIDLRASQLEGYKNLLFYGAKGNDSLQEFTGSVGTYFSGTIWFPDGMVKLGGTSETTSYHNVQVIADKIWVHGTAEINMLYSENNVFTFPSRVSLVK